MRSLRVHGHGSDKYDNIRIGLASRLDTIQAAILSEKLKIFPEEIDARNRIARRYSEGLGDAVIVPAAPAGSTSVWAQYTIRVAGGRRLEPGGGDDVLVNFDLYRDGQASPYRTLKLWLKLTPAP